MGGYDSVLTSLEREESGSVLRVLVTKLWLGLESTRAK